MTGGPGGPDAAGTLAQALPSVLTSLGSTRYAGRALFPLAPARRAVVVLVDGMGDRLVRRRRGHAPFLRGGLDTAYRLVCGYPSTTATSMGTFGTGLPPGAHGMVGYEVLVPETGRLLNELSWDDGPDPRAWQPEPTVFEGAVADGIAVTSIGPGYFDGSGLTKAALRGGRFLAAHTLSARVEAALGAIRATSRSLVYLYWGDLDKVGHVFGVASHQWGAELERIDEAIGRLVAGVPSDTAVYVTADHGMVDVDHALRVDLVDEPQLRQGIRHVGGEPRALQLYCRPGAAADVAATWSQRFGTDALVWTRAESVAQGLFGPVAERVLPRIGDVLVNCVAELAVVDSARMRAELLALVGLHGSVTPDECAIPLFHWPARNA
jgi:hypothetical protein